MKNIKLNSFIDNWLKFIVKKIYYFCFTTKITTEKKLFFYFIFIINQVYPQTTISQFNTLLLSNYNIGLANPLWNDANCSMTYIPNQVNNYGAAFTFNFSNPGGSGFKGYPSGTIGGFKQGSTYYMGNVSSSGLPVQVGNLNQNLRLKWKVSQQNARDVDDKWWATINVIFDNTAANLEPVAADRDYDLVIQLDSFEQDTFDDVPRLGNDVYWYFARNSDNSLKTFDLFIDGHLYRWAVRYKFFNYPVGHINADKNDKVHLKFIPIDNNNVAPYLDHSLKLFIDTTLNYLQYVNLTSSELQLAQQKIAPSSIWIKSVSAGYEVYTGSFTVRNDYFNTVVDTVSPSPPINLIGNESTTGFQLNWNSVSDSDLDSYKIYRSVNNNGVFQLLADNIYTNSYVDSTISNNSSYEYYVVARDRSFNVSTASNHVILNYVSPQDMVTTLGTGINLGNILSAPYEGNWASPLTEDYIDNVARLKFKHVRIPIRFDNQTTPINTVTYTNSSGNYIGSPNNYVVSTSYLDRVEQIIDWCSARNLIAIIDVHGDKWFWESFDSTSPNYSTGNERLAKIDRFKAIWRDISVRFQNKPNRKLIFEIMNEPFFSMNAQEVIDINTQILGVIRNTNPTRCVIVTGGGQNSFQAPMQLTSSFIQSDKNLIATFHYYNPFAFTSSANQNYSDNDWGTITDQQQVQADFDQVYNWSLQNNIPIFLGEFGADNVNGYNYLTQTSGLYGGPDETSRRLYHQFVSSYARAKGFALAVWDAGEKSSKTIYLNSSKSWVKEVRNAVLGSSCNSFSIINNADVECNYDYNWKVSSNNQSTAILNNAVLSESYFNSNTLHLNTISSSTSYDNIILQNDEFTNGFATNTNYEIACFAKGNLNQTFKFRIKLVVNGVVTFLTSEAKNLTNNYNRYNFVFVIPINTTLVQIQLLCGKDSGSYFFDNFSVANYNTIVYWSNQNWSNSSGPTSSMDAVIDGDLTTTSDLVCKDLTINSGKTLIVGAGKKLTVTGNLINNGTLIFKSDATGTAMFDVFNGTQSGSGRVTVERYIPARRAFRFLSSPVTTTTSINTNWQESNGTTAGLGIHITGSGGISNGFDATATNNPSLFTHDNSSQTWSPVLNTNTNVLIAGVPYRVMVRGDRTINLGNNAATPSNTTLRATGTLVTGTKAVSNLNTTADGFSFIGNPYQAPVNMQTVLGAATNLKSFYYAWDPTLGARGAYVSRDVVNGITSTTSAVDNYLQPGQACFVQTVASGSAALSFTEASKYTTATNSLVFRPASFKNASSMIRLTLFSKDLPTASDGAVLIFDAFGDNTVDSNDASKMTNLDENLAIKNSDKLLSIEHRASAVATDEIQLDITQYRATDYTLEVEGINAGATSAYLFDKFNKTYTEIPASGKVSYNYSVDMSNKLSSGSDRFKIVFNRMATEGVSLSTVNDVIMYPNPSTGQGITLSLPASQEESKISISDLLGNILYTETIAEGEKCVLNPKQTLPQGIYLVSIKQANQTVTKKLIVK